MRTIISAAIAALLSTVSIAQKGGNSFGTSTYECYWTYDVPLVYETNYYSGVGPYYDSTIYTSIDNSMHYEEYGFDF